MSDNKNRVHVRYDGLAIPEIYIEDENASDECDDELHEDDDEEIDYDEVAIPEIHHLKHKHDH